MTRHPSSSSDVARWSRDRYRGCAASGFGRRGGFFSAPGLIRVLLLLVLMALSLAAVGEEELIYTAQPGDTVQKVIDKYGVQSLQAEELRRFNKLKGVRQIPPGTKIRFRLGWLKVKPLEARAGAVSGPVTVTRAGELSAEKVVEGSGFRPGDVLETGKGGSVMLLFGDGSRLLLQAESTLTFEVLEKYGDPDTPNIRLHLHRGRVETKVAPNKSPDRRFEIETPAGSAGARGTSFRVGTDEGARQLFTEVTHGTVAVEGGGKELPVAEHFGTVVEAGRPPIPPLPLLPAPDLSGVEPLYRHLPLQIGWSRVPDAVGYRVLLVPSGAGGVVSVDRRVDSAAVELEKLEDGDYQLIVRAIDSHGLEGLDAQRDFTLDAHPLPPRLVTPAQGERLYQGRPEFHWQPSSEAVRYRFQLDVERDFANPVMDILLPSSEGGYRLSEPLAPGRYYWRVASIDKEGEQGLFGTESGFEVSLPPQPPRDLSIRKTAQELKLGWRAEKKGYRYQLQLAADPAFSRVLVERETGQTELTLPRPQEKVYLRMRTLDDVGHPGEYSRPLEIVPPLENLIPLFFLGTAGLVFLL